MQCKYWCIQRRWKRSGMDLEVEFSAVNSFCGRKLVQIVLLLDIQLVYCVHYKRTKITSAMDTVLWLRNIFRRKSLNWIMMSMPVYWKIIFRLGNFSKNWDSRKLVEFIGFQRSSRRNASVLQKNDSDIIVDGNFKE